MARAPQQGVNAVTIWMIVFVVLWLVSTVALVWLYTGQEDLRKRYTQMRDAKEKAVSSQEEQAIELVRDAGQGMTMVGAIESARAATAEMATGTAEDLPATVATRRDEIVGKLAKDERLESRGRYAKAPLLTALNRLYDDYNSLHQRFVDTDQRASELNAKVAELTRQNADQKAGFDEEVGKLSSRVQEIEQGRASFGTSRDAELEQLRKENETRAAQADSDLTSARADLTRCEGDKSELQNRYDELAAKCGAVQISAVPLAAAREADGVVLKALPGDPLVYINLGQRERITLGLEFTVYSAKLGIPADGVGKARIEVVSVLDTTAECRIVDLARNEVILEGDIIANPIYDRDRVLSFYVIGAFDLNRDGIADADGASAVQSLIRNWGGDIATELTALTDFVVLGAAPARPRQAKAGATTDARNEAMLRDADQYEIDLQLAQSLALPMMTQDTFLQFLGYGRRVPLLR